MTSVEWAGECWSYDSESNPPEILVFVGNNTVGGASSVSMYVCVMAPALSYSRLHNFVEAIGEMPGRFQISMFVAVHSTN